MNINLKQTFILSILLMLTSFSSPLFAHAYHYEIQVTNKLQVNQKDELEALKLSFIYGGEVSDVLLQDQKDLNKLGKKLVSDIGRLGYFTQIKLDGKVLNAKKATDIKLEKINIQVEGGSYDTLKLFFTLPLKKPTNMSKTKEINLAHEDPTEAAILYYENADHLFIEGNLKNKCVSSVKEKEKFVEGEFPQIVKLFCK